MIRRLSLGNSSFPVFWPMLVIWLTVFATFSLPGRTIQPTVDALDSVAIVKVAARGFILIALGWIIFGRLADIRTRRIFACLVPWLLFVGWAVLSTIWSPLKSVSLGQAAGQIALIFLAVTVALNSQFEKKYLLQCVLALAAYSGFYGVGSLILPDVFGVDRLSDNGVVHPTALGAAASLGIVISTCLLLTADWKWVKPVCLGSTPVFLLALLAAHNRLSLGLTILICLALITLKGQSYRLAAGAMVSSALGLMYMTLDPGLSFVEQAVGSSVDFFQRGQDVQQLTEFSGRTEMWHKMWQSWRASPIIGHGYFVCSATGTLYVWYHEQNHTAHNLALQALVSTGFVGLAFFSIWILQLVRMYFSIARHPFSSDIVGMLAPALLIWFAGWGMLNASVLGPVRPESAVYAVVVGILAGRYVTVKAGVRSADERQLSSGYVADRGAFE